MRRYKTTAGVLLRILKFTLVCILISSCSKEPGKPSLVSQIVKVIDFELSPDEDKIAFSAITPVGNSDIWIINIDGSNLKKLTFKDRSPSNHIARFFRKHKWRGFFEIDMLYPKWTKDWRIVFCQKLTKYDRWGQHTVDRRYWTINLNGTNMRQGIDKDKVIQKGTFGPINKYKISERSSKHNKTILLKNSILWVLDNGDITPRKLIQ